MAAPKPQMVYRKLGRSGLKVSAIGLGNWVNGNKPEDISRNEEILKRAWELGVNFFDTAEAYGDGEGEVQFGQAIKKLGVPRSNLVITTKIFFGHQPNNGDVLAVNNRGTSAKHVIEGLDRSLKRLQLDYVDVVFAHRFDYETTTEETCKVFDQVIRQGKAFYWATSEWEACQITEAIQICERLGLHKPIADQCEYSILVRENVEKDLGYIFDTYNYGTTVWSPLCAGLLTDKYTNGTIPEGSRFDKNPSLKKTFYDRRLGGEKGKDFSQKLTKLGEVAKRLGCTTAQLAMAWVVESKDVSVAITGASSVKQLEETLQAIEFVPKVTKEVINEISEIFGNAPTMRFDAKKFTARPNRR